MSRLKQLLWERSGGLCHWCKKPLRMSKATIDHLKALADGGSNTPDNKALTCPKCNHERSSAVGLQQCIAGCRRRIAELEALLASDDPTINNQVNNEQIRMAIAKRKKRIAEMLKLLWTHHAAEKGPSDA